MYKCPSCYLLFLLYYSISKAKTKNSKTNERTIDEATINGKPIHKETTDNKNQQRTRCVNGIAQFIQSAIFATWRPMRLVRKLKKRGYQCVKAPSSDTLGYLRSAGRGAKGIGREEDELSEWKVGWVGSDCKLWTERWWKWMKSEIIKVFVWVEYGLGVASDLAYLFFYLGYFKFHILIGFARSSRYNRVLW